MTIHFASVDEPTADLLSLVADDSDYDRWLLVVRTVAICNGGRVSVNSVRRFCAEQGLDFNPRRYSAFWNRATSKGGPLVNTDEWEVCESTEGRNGGKPQRVRRWVDRTSKTFLGQPSDAQERVGTSPLPPTGAVSSSPVRGGAT